MPPPKSGGSASGSGGDQWAEKASKPSTFQMRKLNLKTIDEQGARTHPVESQTERAQPTPSSKFASELAVQPATARAALAVKQSKPAWSSPSIMPDYIDVSRSTSDANFDRQCLVSAEPVSPADAIRLQGGELTDHEKAEILDYQKVYFLGRRACKQTPDLYMKNRGFDDDKGEYYVHVGDHLGYRYQILSPLGKGSFGQVVKCLDHKTQDTVAIKIVRNKRRFQAQAMIEIKILRQLRDNDPQQQSCAIHLKDNFFFRNHHCIVFPLLSLNLYEYMKSTNFEPLPISTIRSIAVQVLRCLRYLREQRIVHCDMKPENIMLFPNSNNKILVIDFGSACFEDERVYTYIQSRFYRAPEVIFGLPYSFPIDMWSFGCILAELFTSYPLFPGENEMDQMACIMEIKGLPPANLLSSAPRAKMFFEPDGQPYIVENSRGKKRFPGTKTLAQVLKCRDRDFILFLIRCLEWEAGTRMTTDEAIQHPWITGSSLSTPPVNSKALTEANGEAGKQWPRRESKKIDERAQKKAMQTETFPPIN